MCPALRSFHLCFQFTPRAVSVATLAVALVLTSGCSSRPERRPTPEANAPKAVLMRGAQPYFDNQLIAHLTVSNGARGFGGPGGGGGRSGPMGGGGGRRGGGGPGGPGGGRGMSDDGQPPVRQIRVSSLGSLVLYLALENQSKENLDVHVLEVNSVLGNFGVRPVHLLLAPGQTAEPDPMISSLGVDSAEITVNVTLKLGDKTEQHAILVQAIDSVLPAPASGMGK